jgi:hypothetical protein
MIMWKIDGNKVWLSALRFAAVEMAGGAREFVEIRVDKVVPL